MPNRHWFVAADHCRVVHHPPIIHGMSIGSWLHRNINKQQPEGFLPGCRQVRVQQMGQQHFWWLPLINCLVQVAVAPSKTGRLAQFNHRGGRGVATDSIHQFYQRIGAIGNVLV